MRRRNQMLALAALGASLIAVAVVVALAERRDEPAPGSATTSMTHASAQFAGLEPDEFGARLARPSAMVVNVNTRYYGEITGTDEFVPYDQITAEGLRLDDRDAEVLLYSRSDRQSVMAANALVEAGYTNVVYLAGGMDAWEAAGNLVRTDLD